jgi:hypothetical protein
MFQCSLHCGPTESGNDEFDMEENFPTDIQLNIPSQGFSLIAEQRIKGVRHVTGNDEDYLRKIPRVVVQKSALYKGPL